MDIARFIKEMPKVELNARLEGYYRKDVLMLIAEENEIAADIKHFDTYVDNWGIPDFSKLDKHVRGYMEWLRHPDDLTRLVYDVGVALSRENVKYAEVSINSVLHKSNNMSFDDFMSALNDGRDRVQRAWGLTINWVMTVPRDVPRSADDALRWAANATGRKAGIVAFGISGSEAAQPAGQFQRAFDTAAKKEIPVVAQAGDTDGVDGVKAVLDLGANRLVDGWGVTEDPDTLTQLVTSNVPLLVSPGRAVKLGWVDQLADYPLQQLQDAGVPLVISAEMPAFYDHGLSDCYTMIAETFDLDVDALQGLVMQGVAHSYLPEDEKEQLKADFITAFEQLREDMLSSSEA